LKRGKSIKFNDSSPH